MSERDEPFGAVPDQGADPIVWDPVQRRFVPESERARGPARRAGPDPDPGLAASPPVRGVVERSGPAPRRSRVPADAVGRSLPPQPGTPPGAAAGGPGPQRSGRPGAAPPRQVVVAAPAPA